MSLNGLSPIIFESVSAVTATLGDRSPDVGDRRAEGGLEYIYCYNAGGSDIPPGYGAVAAAGCGVASVTVSSVSGADRLFGVCQHATLTTATYGWLATRGVVAVEVPDACASLDLLQLEANGGFGVGSVVPDAKALAAIASGASGNAYIG